MSFYLIGKNEVFYFWLILHFHCTSHRIQISSW
jgi:hypothetical protein